MNDPIKDFIEENRAEFDHLEAPKFDLQKFKAQSAEKLGKEKPVVKLSFGTKWLAAASVVLVVAAFLFYKQNDNNTSVKLSSDQNASIKPAGKTVGIADDEKAGSRVEKESQEVFVQADEDGAKTKELVAKAKGRSIRKPLQENKSKSAEILYKNLADSSSSSTRLAAILEIKRQGTISNYLVDRLASTLNNDNNSNVRLAALDILGRYNKDQYVSSLLVSSLNTQIDPMVQLELVTLLGTMDHVKIEDKLYALTADPNTFGAVKEEAYNILLNKTDFKPH